MNGQMQRPKPEMISVKDDLKDHQIALHNMEHEVLKLKAVIKKLEELAR